MKVIYEHEIDVFISVLKNSHYFICFMLISLFYGEFGEVNIFLKIDQCLLNF